jgi:hypothetical protein
MKKIAFLSQPEYFRLHYLDFLLYSKYTVREFKLKFNSNIENYQDLLEFNPDFLISFRGEFVPNELLKKIDGVKIALSSEPFPRIYNGSWDYTSDSVYRYETFRAIRNKYFDYVFHYDKHSAKLFELDGLQLSGYFNFPISTRSIYPTHAGKKWDLSFIGRSSERREKLMGYLKHHYNFLHIAHGIVGTDINYYLNRSLISLNIHASDEISWEPRLQILMASGCMAISEKIIPNNLLVENKHYVAFDGEKDLVDKVAHYLANLDEVTMMAKNARLLMEAEFSALDYFSNLIENIGSYAKFSATHSSSSFTNILNASKIKKLTKEHDTLDEETLLTKIHRKLLGYISR